MLQILDLVEAVQEVVQLEDRGAVVLQQEVHVQVAHDLVRICNLSPWYVVDLCPCHACSVGNSSR